MCCRTPKDSKKLRIFQKKNRKMFNGKEDFLKMKYKHFFCNLCRYFMNNNWIFFEHSRLYRSKFHVWLHFLQTGLPLLISNFPRVLNAVYFLLGDSPVSEFYVSTSPNALSVPKRSHIKSRRRRITQNK